MASLLIRATKEALANERIKQATQEISTLVGVSPVGATPAQAADKAMLSVLWKENLAEWLEAVQTALVAKPTEPTEPKKKGK